MKGAIMKLWRLHVAEQMILDDEEVNPDKYKDGKFFESTDEFDEENSVEYTKVQYKKAVLPKMILKTNVKELDMDAARAKRQVVHTQAKVIVDQDAMYKYISKNMLFVATVSPKATGPIGSATPEEASLVVSLVDTVTGRILHRVTHPASQAPVHAVFSKNWVIYHYFNLRAHRYQMSVIEIYDESRADNKDVLKLIVGKHNLTSPISSYSRPEVLVKSQSYYFTQSVKTMAVTATAKGITSKQILVGTIGDQVLALDKRFLDPRRTVNPTQSEKEEGIIPLTDSLPIIPQGSQSFQSQAANLEQTITPTRGPSLCKLQHMTKKHIIAYGRLQGTELPEAGFYRIVLDEIVDGSVDLFDGERKLGDVILGDVLDWPIIRTILY